MKVTKKLDYQWVIVALSFLMIFISVGVCTTTKGIFVVPICDALNITRSAYSLHSSFQYVTTFIMSMFFGTFVAKFGIKKLIVAGQVALILANAVFIFSKTAAAFCVGGVIMGIGCAWTATSMVGTIVNRWCTKHQGTIMGVIFAANGVGGALGTMILTPIIYQDTYGYRNAYLFKIITLLVIGLLLLFFFRENPEENAITAEGGKKKSKLGWEGISFAVAKKKWFFYGAAACALIVGMIMQGVNTVMAAHFDDVGFGADYIATVVSVYSVTLALGKFFSGVIYDKFGFRTNIFLCTISMFLSLVLMCVLDTSATGRVFAMIAGILTGIALPLETILIPIYIGEMFGDKDFSRIVGIFEALTNAGFALGIPLMNLAFDFYGSYNNSFIISAVCMAAVFVVLNLVLNSARRLKNQDNKESI